MKSQLPKPIIQIWTLYHTIRSIFGETIDKLWLSEKYERNVRAKLQMYYRKRKGKERKIYDITPLS